MGSIRVIELDSRMSACPQKPKKSNEETNDNMTNEHYLLKYASQINELLHYAYWPTWFYKHEIFEIPGLLSAIIITYDHQEDDEFVLHTDSTWNDFHERLNRISLDVGTFEKDSFEILRENPHKVFYGWEARTIYIIRGGNNPGYWTEDIAYKDLFTLISASTSVQGPLLKEKLESIDEYIPIGSKGWKEFEDTTRIIIGYLFDELGVPKAQERTEPGNEGTEIRDIICQNSAEKGFWSDIKYKYDCSEIVFEIKNKRKVTRDDLRQIYCYLKPAIGYWGFIVCRSHQQSNIDKYNRTLFQNFGQQRGILIIDVQDLQRMMQIKLSQQDPSEYLRQKMSSFIRSI